MSEKVTCPLMIGTYAVKAHEVEAPFIAYWNGHKWIHGAMRYNINIHTWIKK